MLNPVFHALADPTRREILGMLRSSERSTGAIADAFPLSRPTVSKHLKVLLDARLVERRKEGRNQLYTLRPQHLAEAHEWLSRYQRFWRRSLTRLKRHVEEGT
jgi:DNA-binding transcriptional ArsR family regulator